MRILGQFRDLADPDRFVWVRDFPDMEARTRALEGFYSGPVWKEHSPVANATMIDHTNVLLLRPAGPELGFRFDPRLRPPPDAGRHPGRRRRRDDLSPRRPGLAGHRGVAVRGERARNAARPPRDGTGTEPGGATSRPRGRECVRDIRLLSERGRLRAADRDLLHRVPPRASAAGADPPLLSPPPMNAADADLAAIEHTALDYIEGFYAGDAGSHGARPASGAGEAHRARRPAVGAQPARGDERADPGPAHGRPRRPSHSGGGAPERRDRARCVRERRQREGSRGGVDRLPAPGEVERTLAHRQRAVGDEARPPVHSLVVTRTP